MNAVSDESSSSANLPAGSDTAGATMTASTTASTTSTTSNASTTTAASPSATRIGLSFNVTPLGDISGNLPRLLGESILELVGMFYPSTVGKKANVVVSELVQNVLENIVDPHSELLLELHVDGDALVVRVTNKATPEQFEGVRARVDALTGAADPKKLFSATLRARRADRLKGGLGLMRLVSENRFRLGVSYAGGLLTMQAAFPLRGSV